MPFDFDRLLEVGRRIRDLYPAKHPDRIRAKVDDRILDLLGRGVAGALGGRIGVSPRLFLRKLVGDLLDKVDQFEDFDPQRDFKPVVQGAELNAAERHAADGGPSLDDLELLDPDRPDDEAR